MSNKRRAIALRPTVYEPRSIPEIVKVLDESGSVSHVFVPDIRGSFDSIEVSAVGLGASQKLHIGSGVIRILEQDLNALPRRLKSLQALSSNRFILGIGAGNPGPNPKATIDLMLQSLDKLHSEFGSKTDFPETAFPETYIATLKTGIAKRVAGRSDGILLNFCSPNYAKAVITSYKDHCRDKDTDFACYMKVFYSKERGVAEQLLVEEFARYDTIPQYHEMFVSDGIAKDIVVAKKMLKYPKSSVNVPQSLAQISLANPDKGELQAYVREFTESGVTLPCIYPYFPRNEDGRFIVETMRNIAEYI